MSYMIVINGWGPDEANGADAKAVEAAISEILRDFIAQGHQVPKATCNDHAIALAPADPAPPS